MGESWKKVKFSDFIYMQRIRDDLNIFSPDVAKYVFKENSSFSIDSPKIINIKDEIIRDLKPIEMRVTKSKEKGKGYFRYMLFCSRNLRIYNYIDEYIEDTTDLLQNNKKLISKIEKISTLAKINNSIIDNGGLFIDEDSPIIDNDENLWESTDEHDY